MGEMVLTVRMSKLMTQEWLVDSNLQKKRSIQELESFLKILEGGTGGPKSCNQTRPGGHRVIKWSRCLHTAGSV